MWVGKNKPQLFLDQEFMFAAREGTFKSRAFESLDEVFALMGANEGMYYASAGTS